MQVQRVHALSHTDSSAVIYEQKLWFVYMTKFTSIVWELFLFWGFYLLTQPGKMRLEIKMCWFLLLFVDHCFVLFKLWKVSVLARVKCIYEISTRKIGIWLKSELFVQNFSLHLGDLVFFSFFSFSLPPSSDHEL